MCSSDLQILSPAVALWSLLQGSLVLAMLGGLYVTALHRNLPADEARTLVFVALVMANLALVLVNRSFGFALNGRHRGSNRALLAVFGVATAILTVATQWGPARDLFQFGDFHLHDLAIAAGGCLGLVAVLELLKRLLHARLTA